LEPLATSLTARFIHDHETHVVTGASADAIVAIPSSRGRPGNPPLFDALNRVPSLRERLRLVLAPSKPIAHQKAQDDGFLVTDNTLKGRRVLLADDTFTSGAAIQSAASALQLAGIEVAAAVVVGRFITLSEEHGPSPEWWDEHRKSQPFTFSVCSAE
jgi:hypothetical protein